MLLIIKKLYLKSKLNLMITKIAPSILAADFGKLNEEIELINSTNASFFHIDVMDGRFVPNISFGFPVLDSIWQKMKKPLDIHLMIVEPEKYVEQFAKYSPEFISVHIEACPHLHRTIQQIKSYGVKAGVVLNPHTPINTLETIITDVDLVLLMSVNPGFGGQKFIENTIYKTKELKHLINSKKSRAVIEIDGGVTPKNSGLLIDAGADILVAGSSVFNATNPKVAIEEMMKPIRRERII